MKNHATTVEQLARLDAEEIQRGYWAGMDNKPAPGDDKCAGFAHGWRNGRVDGCHAECDAAQHALWVELGALRAVAQ